MTCFTNRVNNLDADNTDLLRKDADKNGFIYVK